MTYIKLFVIALVAANILLIGLEASKPPAQESPVEISPVPSASNLPRIRLLNEFENGPATPTRNQCFTVGPFEAQATAEAIVEMLQEHASRVSARSSEAFVDRGFWVYLPPFENEQSARQAVNVLFDAGIEDVALIRNGEWNNSVSLGYFISQSNATRHRDRIRSLGFEAEYRIQRDDESRFWVDYEQQTGVEYASRMLAGLIPPELHRATACAETYNEPDLQPVTS